MSPDSGTSLRAPSLLTVVLCASLLQVGCTLDFDTFEPEENFGARDTGSADTGPPSDGCGAGQGCPVDTTGGDADASDAASDTAVDPDGATDADGSDGGPADTRPDPDGGDTSPVGDTGPAEDTADPPPDCSAPDVGTLPDGTCACETDGETRPCYNGPSGTAGEGVCQEGTRTCTDGTWSLCTGQTQPSKEVCDGKDNDCNGQTDELRKCLAKAGEPCRGASDCRSDVCAGGKCAHRVFVSSSTWTGALGGLAGADSKCTNAASAAGMAGSWKAILSHKGTHAIDRLRLAAPIHNMKGQRIANGKSDLWNPQENLDRPINVDENGSSVSGRVWTATSTNGKWVSSQFVTLQTCSKWQSTGGQGATGKSSQTNYTWIIDFMTKPSCSQKSHLYCVDGQ